MIGTALIRLTPGELSGLLRLPGNARVERVSQEAPEDGNRVCLFLSGSMFPVQTEGESVAWPEHKAICRCAPGDSGHTWVERFEPVRL
jgi:hypothetical protein